METLREKQKRGSLLWVLDKTKTAMGARMLRSYVEQPLIDKAEIEKRQDAIGELNQHDDYQRGTPGIFESDLRSGASDHADYISDRQSAGI